MNIKIISIYCLSVFLLVSGCDSTSNKEVKQLVAEEENIKTESLKDVPEQSWNFKLDSLIRESEKAKQDTNLVQLFIDIGRLYSDNDFEKAKEYFHKAGNLSEKTDWKKGKYLYAINFSNILYREGLADSSIVIIRNAYETAKKEKNEYWIARTSHVIGNGYFYKSWYETALEYYLAAMQVIENSGDKETLIRIYDNSGVVYRILGLPEKAIELDKKALALFDENDETLLKGYVFYNLATALHILKDEQTVFYFNEALRICKLHNSQYVIAAIYLALGNLALNRDLKEAEDYFHKALKITSEINNPNLSGLANLNLSFVEMFKQNLKQSQHYCITSIDIAQQIGYAEYQVNAYRQLSTLYAMKNDFTNFTKFSTRADSVERVIARESSRRSAEEMQAKYETEKKELKIAALEDEKQFMIWLSIAGGAVMLLALAAFFLLWRWTVQKKRVVEQQRQLAEQQVKQLEQEKQLVATQAVLDGETRERARLARDLHDGLGSILTGAKLSLLEMKKGATLEYVNLERFNKAMGLLDKSIQEMRRVAHNLMPDSLNRFGLKSAVSDFCSNLPSVRFIYYGEETRLDPKLEVMIYRSIHELVNNALKHSDAENINVQIIQESERIAFNVQDNGCGFDASTILKGTGLQNIRHRVTSYNGIMNIDSRKDEGTEINIELKLE